MFDHAGIRDTNPKDKEIEKLQETVDELQAQLEDPIHIKQLQNINTSQDKEIKNLKRLIDPYMDDTSGDMDKVKFDWDCLKWESELEDAKEEIEELKKWIDDLQSGMYINCVYCGHRYGPKENTPSSMADVLKEHIEQCPKHPMSQLKKEIEELKKL